MNKVAAGKVAESGDLGRTTVPGFGRAYLRVAVEGLLTASIVGAARITAGAAEAERLRGKIGFATLGTWLPCCRQVLYNSPHCSRLDDADNSQTLEGQQRPDGAGNFSKPAGWPAALRAQPVLHAFS